MNQEKVWDGISEEWGEYRKKVFGDVGVFLEKLSREKKGKVLEIGCGNCRNLILFAKRGFKCFGIDFSAGMLKEAEKFCRENKIKVEMNKSNAEKLSFNDESFDYVLMISVLHNLKKRNRALEEVYRVLKKRGKFLVSVWNRRKDYGKEKEISWHGLKRHYYFYSPDELERLLRNFRFKILEKKVGKNICFLVEK